MGKTPLSHSRELQPHPMTGVHMSHLGLNTDLPFLHKKFQFACRTHGHPHARVNEQTSQAKIPHCGSIAMSSAAPIHPHTLWGLNS